MSDTTQPHPLRGVFLALVAFAIFAGHDVIVKLLGAHYAPVQIVFFSVLFGFPTVIIALLRDSTDGNLRPKHPWWSLLRTAATVLSASCVFYAFSVLPLAETYAILFATPLIITLLSVPLLGEKVRFRRWMAVLVGLCGVLVVLQPGQTTLTGGHLAGLAAAFGGAFAAIVVRKIGPDERPVVLILYPMVANFLVMGAALPFFYKPMPIEHLGFSAAIAFFAAIGGYLIILAYRSSEAVLVAPTQYSQIIWATIFGFLFFDETPSNNVILGAGIIIASGIYILWRESRPDTSATKPLLRGFYSRLPTGTSIRTGLLALRRRELNGLSTTNGAK
jgi:drug/metabolite transporter (DMT)-like permease